MRIISPYHDYYDGVQGQGFDDKILYKRTTVQTNIKGRDSATWGDRGWTQFQPEADLALLPEFHTFRPELRNVAKTRHRYAPSWDPHRYDDKATSGTLFFCAKAYPFWFAQPPPDDERDTLYSFEDGFDEIARQRLRPKKARRWYNSPRWTLRHIEPGSMCTGVSISIHVSTFITSRRSCFSSASIGSLIRA